MSPRAGRGFTLVELMLVVVIIGVLAAMVVPRLAGRTEQAKIARAKSDIAAIGLALDLCELDTGKYPEGLPALTNSAAPSGIDQNMWRGPYLKRGVPTDPWGHEYQYKYPAQSSGMDYDLLSLGPDGQQGKDDVSNAEEK